MKVLKKVQNAIKRGSFGKAREVLSQQSETLPVDTGPVFTPFPEEETDLLYADLQKDYGSGRVSQGLIFLELISLSRKGKDLNSILSFDRVPQFANADAIDSAQTDDDKLQFINTSLGTIELMTELRILKKDVYESNKARLLEVFNDVSEGIFFRKNNQDVLRLLRKSVATLSIVKKRGDNQ